MRFSQVEIVVKSLTAAQDHEKISNVIALLTYDFALSPQANNRKVRNLLSQSEFGILMLFMAWAGSANVSF